LQINFTHYFTTPSDYRTYEGVQSVTNAQSAQHE